MKRSIEVELDDDINTLSYDLTGAEELAATPDGHGATLFVNPAGAEALAKILLKLALGNYEPGFHVHLKHNFGEEPSPDILTVIRQA